MEQSYKEKYEQAIERLKQWDREHPCAGYVLSDRDKFIFPELAESEDERIRNGLVRLLKELLELGGVAEDEWDRNECEKYIAWLEKQASYTTIVETGNGGINALVTRELPTDGEQKPADTVEPKFKVGDKIYLKPEYRMPNDDTPIANTVKEIRRIDDKHYRFDGSYIFIEDQDKYELVEQKPKENKGNIGGISPNSAWSEENAPQKELVESYLAKFDEKFPILPTLKGKRLADYKNFLNRCQQIFRLKYWGIRPTQARLFEKLSLLWAAWGAEHLQGLGQTYGDMDDEILWSEEDEQHIDSLLKRLDALCRNKFERTRFAISEDRDWLKSLKGRVQPKQEWSEEDSQYIDDAFTLIGFGLSTHTKGEVQEWLLSLKGRVKPQWKPSDEQIAQLQIVIDTYGNEGIYDPILTELLFQLKKLRGKV